MSQRSHSSCVYNLQYHLVFVTKYRNKCLNAEIIDSLGSHFSRLLEMKDCSLIEFNGEDDHVHLLIELHPSIEPSKLINNLKTVSSRMMKKEFGERLKKYYWGTNALWNRSYCLLSVGGAPIEVLKQYIVNQKKPD